MELVQKPLSGMAGFVGWIRMAILRLRSGIGSDFAIFRTSLSWFFFVWLALSSLLCLLRDLCHNFENAILLSRGILCWLQTVGPGLWVAWNYTHVLSIGLICI
jgi:hypothetical protein